MADRTVRVILTGNVTPFQAAMQRAAQVTQQTAQQIDRSASRFQSSWTNAAQSASRSMDRLRLAAYDTGSSMLNLANNGRKSLEVVRNASIALVAGFALAAAAAARFDKAMSEVRAVTNGTAADMQRLSKAALDAGQATIYSATQAAKAEAELARAGISTADIIGGALKGSLDLAASGQLELAEAAIISAQAMNAFKLGGRDVGHIADVISAGAGKSATNVHDMGQAFRQAALLSSQTGLSLEQTVGTLSLFAQNALTGSDAGTSLKVMLQRLVPQSKEAAATMEQIGLNAYDAQGNFIGLTALAGNMQAAFSRLTPEARNAAMATIFGSDAVRAATILYEAGSRGVTTWTKAVDDSGYATRVAATMTDNLHGDLERLKGALESALITSGSAGNAILRDMAQALTNVVNWYNQLSPAMQRSIATGAGLLGMIGLIGSGLLLMLPRIMAVRRELVALGVTATRVRTAMSAIGRVGAIVAGLAAVGYGVQLLKDQMREAPPSADKLTNSLLEFSYSGKVAGELAKQFGTDLGSLNKALKQIVDPSVTDQLNHFTEQFRLLSDEDVFGTDFLGLTTEKRMELERARDLIKGIDDSLANLVRSGADNQAAAIFKKLATEAEKGGTSAEKFKGLLHGYTDALAASDTQAKLTAGGQKTLADAMAMTSDEIQDQRTEAEKLTDTLNALNGVAISAAEKEIAFRSSLQELTDAVKENGRSLDVTSEKGRAVKSAFLDAAQAAMAHAQAVAEQKGSIEAGNAVLAQDIGLLKRQMTAAGFSAEAIDKLIGTYAKLPPAKITDVRARGAAEAAAETLRLKARIDSLYSKNITITTHYRIVGSPNVPDGRYLGSTPGRSATGGLIRGYAGGGGVQWMPWGGPVYGPGTETSDSVPTWLSRGEYVIKAASVRRYGLAMMDRLNAGRYAAGGYAGGGFTYTPSGPPVLGGVRNPQERYNTLLGYLKDAWRNYNEAVADLRKLQKDRKATRQQKNAVQQRVSNMWNHMLLIDRSLGVKAGAQVPKGLDLNAYQKQLTDSLISTERWRANLTKVGARGGAEIRDILEGMGEEGYALTEMLAKASNAQFADIAAKLKKVAGLAKATLSDFTGQLNASTAESQQFAADLQTLAARGFGDLAQALAAQGDPAARQLARQAASGGAGDAAKANEAVKRASSGLTAEELTASLVLLSTLRGAPGRGIADVIAAGLSWSTIRSVAPKMMGRINGLPPEFRQRFVSQLVGQGVIPAMARGGILTAPTVLAGEAGPEAFIPLNGSQRSRALLTQTAALMGYTATPARRIDALSGPASSVSNDNSRHATVNLHGAKQTAAEQAHDIIRHLQYAG